MRTADDTRLCPRCFGEASDPVPRVLDRAGPTTTTTTGTRSTMPQRAGGGSAPLTLNLLLPKSARGLPNLARIPQTQTCQTLRCPWTRSNEFTPFSVRPPGSGPSSLLTFSLRRFHYQPRLCRPRTRLFFYFELNKLKEMLTGLFYA